MSESIIYFSDNLDTLHHAFPFNLIQISDIKEAILKGIEIENNEIENIISSPHEPTFENTVEAYEKTGSILDNATTYMYNMLSANTSIELENLAEEMSSILSEHSSDILHNKKLWKRIKIVEDEVKSSNDEEKKMLYHKICCSFKRSGANLNDGDKKKLRKIKTELSKLTLKFSRNNLRETNSFILHLTNPEDLDGLPKTQIEQARIAAKEKGLEGWIITLHAPSYLPFMTYSKKRDLRKKLYMAYNTKCTHNNVNNNFDIVRSIVNYRLELANLLGYKTYADYVLENRMAENTKNVQDFLHQLVSAYKDKALQEVDEVKKIAHDMDGENIQLQPWDFSYYAHNLKKRLFDFDAEMLRPYFELSSVVSGVFSLANRLYGISFKRNKTIPVYNTEVEAYEVYDYDSSFLAVLYTDYHPRASKQGGAWMTNFKEEWDGINRPHVAITMNLSKPTEEEPALLTLSEVETFLHEFGHALHGIFAKTKYRSLSGTNVCWDFVELPSQFMENYALEKDFLITFAKHYKTGEVIPDELIEKIVAAKNFNVAYSCMRQVSFGLIDMAYYTLTKKLKDNDDIRDFEHHAWEKAQVLPQVKETCMSVQFGHIMSGGYAAGYYSYKWAEVLDADAFNYFKENGIFNRKIANSFRNDLLALGGTKKPMDLYVKFRGHKPTINALLKRTGVLV